MRRLLAFCLVVTACGCVEQSSLCGKYKIAKPAFRDKLVYFLKVRGVIAGSELFLEQDSSFIYTTCGNVMSGTWSYRRKHLYLSFSSNKFRNESLNDSLTLDQPFLKIKYFKIRHGRLYHIANTEAGRYIEILSKTESEN